ncbi:hypothetical protein MKX01_024588 [Papaver californicum]|nr:hypothetical protein MKX01_024588 [Papaver californicum]
MNKNKASSVLGVFYIFLIVVSTAAAAAINRGCTPRAKANEFRVGGKVGWHSLYLEYRNDFILKVEIQGYYHCNMTAVIASFNDGKTDIKLDKPILSTSLVVHLIIAKMGNN